LVCGKLRLIWIEPTTRRYFVLLSGRKPIGKVEVRTDSPSDEKVRQLATLLALAGFTGRTSHVLPGDVQRFPRKLNRVPNLFTLADS